ncbi:Multiple C2 and transmembrane domain-containing protein 1 [Liparis tanakae]|uniref:Multiple C2 and transmembrane domain-containing protein 1 n=1 Tax=Liparis tanakae TaxID=230148 RepID=A0A4Z2G8G8_9TELE|nr:Multiple C2 and transmembrane domain-containing protein 1 [Liparis tanakae]
MAASGSPMFRLEVFDYDFGLQDDFMGSARLPLEALEQNRTTPVTLELKDPHHPDEDLGSVDLVLVLTPSGPVEERRDSATMLLRRSWKRSTKVNPRLRLRHHHRHLRLHRGHSSCDRFLRQSIRQTCVSCSLKYDLHVH